MNGLLKYRSLSEILPNILVLEIETTWSHLSSVIFAYLSNSNIAIQS